MQGGSGAPQRGGRGGAVGNARVPLVWMNGLMEMDMMCVCVCNGMCRDRKSFVEGGVK